MERLKENWIIRRNRIPAKLKKSEVRDLKKPIERELKAMLKKGAVKAKWGNGYELTLISPKYIRLSECAGFGCHEETAGDFDIPIPLTKN